MKDEVKANIQKFDKKLKISTPIIENVLKIQLAAPEMDFSEFHGMAYEKEVISKGKYSLSYVHTLLTEYSLAI